MSLKVVRKGSLNLYPLINSGYMTKPFSFLIKKKGRPKCSEERLFLFVLFFLNFDKLT